MSNVLNRLRKRHGSPVAVNGETFHVRSLTIGDLRRLEAITNAPLTGSEEEQKVEKALRQDRRTGLFYGLAVCVDESGEPGLPKLPDETDIAYADRLLNELVDVPTETLATLSAKVTEIGKLPKVEGVLKN